MRFYQQRHQYTCGVDLHAKTMYLCILDRDGQVVLHRDLPAIESAMPPTTDELLVA